jgi:hypothetical protein
MTCKNIQCTHKFSSTHTGEEFIILQCQLQDGKYYLPPAMCNLWPSIHRRNSATT